MKNHNRHIVHRVNLEINADKEPKAFEIRAKIDDFLKEELFPCVETLFDESTSPDEIKRFDTINLELEMNSSDHLESVREQLINQLRAKIEDAESEISRPTITGTQNSYQSAFSGKLSIGNLNKNSESVEFIQEKMSSAVKLSNLENTFLYFLESGQLPWFAIPSFISEFTQRSVFNSSLRKIFFLAALKNLITSNKNALERFIQQFDNKMIETLIFRLSEDKNIDSSKLHLKISSQHQSMKEVLYKLIINRLIHPDYQITNDQYVELSNEILNTTRSEARVKKRSYLIQEILQLFNLQITTENLSIQKSQKLPVNESFMSENAYSGYEDEYQSSTNIDLKAVYIQNAGLILPHPFLWDLFTRINCSDEKSTLLPEKKSLAIHLLHYLATDQEQEMEYNLTFEKFLCGVPLDSPVNRKIALSDADKIECNDLLQSIINYWSALKNTSPDGLRQMFIQRDGKLDLQKAPRKLYVERKAQDILLEKLQWNISVVKLPWLKELLFVEW